MAISNQPRSFQFFSGVSATQPDFNADAGNYALNVASIAAGSLQLQQLLPDGATYANVGAAVAAAGYQVISIPAGQYRFVVTTGPVTYEFAKIDVGRASGR